MLTMPAPGQFPGGSVPIHPNLVRHISYRCGLIPCDYVSTEQFKIDDSTYVLRFSKPSESIKVYFKIDREQVWYNEFNP